MQKIIFDCDNTVGIEGYPMDDALAFLYLLGNRGRAQVLAFCCTFGNGTAQQVYESSGNCWRRPDSAAKSRSIPAPGRGRTPVEKAPAKLWSLRTAIPARLAFWESVR